MLRRLLSWLPTLLRWLASFFESRSTLDLYTPTERSIYRYFDGEKMVHADPMVLFKRFVSVRQALAVEFQVSNFPGHKDAPAAHGKAMKLIRDVFDLKEFAEGGLTETESLMLLDHFIRYCDSVKKKPPGGPISATEALPPSPPSRDGSRATSGSSDSGSTASDTITEPPTPLPSEPPSPLASSNQGTSILNP